MDSIDDILKGILANLNGWKGDSIGSDKIDNYIIDTCETSDYGWKTAIRKTPLGDWVIVARYPNKEEAQAGHNTWCSFLKLNRPTHAYSVQTEKIEVL
jgi:hypothetical protein